MENSHFNNREAAKSTNPEQNLQRKESNIKPNHSQHNHDELDSDCEGCQAEKKENQRLVDFYQRLDKISTKVKKFKSHKNPANNLARNEANNMQNQTISTPKQMIMPQNIQQKLRELEQKINIPELPSVSQIKEFSSKEIGFELAAALIERQMKYKNQNKKLQERINELLAQKKKKQQNQAKLSNSFLNHPSKNDFRPQLESQTAEQHQIKDSLDDLKGKQKIDRKHRDDASFWDIDNTSTTNGFKYQETTFFQTKKRNNILGSDKTKLSRRQFDIQPEQTQSIPPVEKKKNLYNTEQGYGLNLWLYQFKAEEYEDKIQNSWMSDKNKSQLSERYSNGVKKRQSEGNKSPRMPNVNKTSIIQKNLANSYSPVVQNKRKNY